ncbi:MAG: transketolase, partial [Geminicoccaceae bacterium]
FMRFDPSAPDWADRDRFVLSAGHGSMLIYALLHLTGYADMTLEELKAFRQLGARTAGHPEYGHAPGIETTTGPLGQGLANAVGMALAERLMHARYGADLVDHWTYVIAGDGCLMEGISHEAASLAGHLRLGRLIVLFDDNGISIDGPTALAVSDDQGARFAAYGWHTLAIDGHDPAQIEAAIAEARHDPRPSLIACKTVIGFGAPSKQGTAATHGAPLGEDEIAATRAALGWPHAPFVIPDDVLTDWRAIGTAAAKAHTAWQRRFEAADPATRAAFEAALAGTPPAGLDDAMAAYKARLAEEQPSWATRKSSQEALEVLSAQMPTLLGGSADLTGSNNTKTKATAPITAEDFTGRYIHYGVREHAMAAAMNGIALHGGFVPYGGTFLVFADYSRPAIRLAALMGLPVIHVMTHDSIGLGEDGPTHQPIEHLASLRAMPNLHVFRPADAMETAECWQAALARRDGPSLLALSRQGLPALRTEVSADNLCAKGGYVLKEASGARALTLLATGSEVALAMQAAATLEADGLPTAVVSLPCFELFDRQDAAYRDAVLGSAPRLAIEAASPFGWSRYVASEADVLGLTGFGASAPAKELYATYGLTADALVELARTKLAETKQAA